MDNAIRRDASPDKAPHNGSAVSSTSPSPLRRPTVSPSSSHFAVGTASSRSRGTAIASSRTQPFPSPRYETVDPVEGRAPTAQGEAVESTFSFPSTSASLHAVHPSHTSPLDGSCRPRPSPSGPQQRDARTESPVKRSRTSRLMSPAQRRAQKWESVQELIYIADAADVAVKSQLRQAKGSSPGRRDGAPPSPRSPLPVTRMPNVDAATGRASLVGAEIEEALRGRHRHSVVVVPEEAKEHFDSVLRAGPALGPSDRGTTARVVTDARDFSMDVYRELHHRTFHSKSEELTFLRHDYVSLRKTLMLLYDENARLKGCLRERAEEVSRLQACVEICDAYHKGAESAGGGGGESESDNEAKTASHPVRRPGAASRAGSRTPQRKAARPVSDSLHSEAPSPDHAHRDSNDADDTETDKDDPSSSLWLHAAAQKAVLKITTDKSKGRPVNVHDLNTVQLINELRRNLARRDTQLDALRLENVDFAHARDVLEKNLDETREALRTLTHDRNRLLQVVEEKDAALDELDRLKRDLEKDQSEKAEQLATLTNELEKQRLLQRTPPTQLGDDATAAVSSSTSSSPAEVQALRDAIDDYRQRWRAAEDRVDQLLQAARVLPATGGASGGGWTDTPSHAPAPSASSSPPMTDGERQRFERELRQQADELHRLHRRLEREQEAAQFREGQQRQQAQDQARLHQTELAAVQAQLQAVRAQLAREGQDRDALVKQLRHTNDHDALTQVLQAQLGTLKQRLSEVGGQLSEVRGREQALLLEVQKAQHDKLLLTRASEAAESGMRRAQQEESLRCEELAMLRTQLGASEGKVYALEQMIAALQKRARRSPGGDGDGDDDGELEPQIKASPTMSADMTHATRFCQCDAHVAPTASATSSVPRATRVDNAEALASDLKGYAALMDLNAALTARLHHLEDALADATHSLEVSRAQQQDPHVCEADNQESDAPDQAPTAGPTETLHAPEPFVNEELARQRYVVLTELQALRHDLQLSQRAQQTLLVQWQDLRQRHDELEDDNAILAEGTAVIHDELMALLKEKEEREQAIAAGAPCSSPPPASHAQQGRTDAMSRVAVMSKETQVSADEIDVDVDTDSTPRSSRRVRSLRSTVEDTRSQVPTNAHCETRSVSRVVGEDEETIDALLEENRTLARRLQSTRNHVRSLMTELSQKRGALATARRELSEYEELIRLLDKRMVGGDGQLWERVLTHRRAAVAATRPHSRRRYDHHHLDAALNDSSSEGSSASMTASASHEWHRRRRQRSPRMDASLTLSLYSDDGAYEKARASDSDEGDVREKKDMTRPSSRLRSSSRPARWLHHHAGAWRRRRRAHTPPSHIPPPSAASIVSTDIELYAVDCHAHRDENGVLTEEWSAVPLTAASAMVDDATDSQPVPRKTKKTRAAASSRSVARAARSKGKATSERTPRSARSTSSTATTSITAVFVAPRTLGATC